MIAEGRKVRMKSCQTCRQALAENWKLVSAVVGTRLPSHSPTVTEREAPLT
ncbi:hypothetical protein J6590_012970 [Homalodisca vitripennis]|nr:hypothetical protein J6590_012970 [Homalodisca vitripennis]